VPRIPGARHPGSPRSRRTGLGGHLQRLLLRATLLPSGRLRPEDLLHWRPVLWRLALLAGPLLRRQAGAGLYPLSRTARSFGALRARVRRLVEHLRRTRSYRVRVVGPGRRDGALIDGIDAVWSGDPDSAAAAISEARVIVTAVGVRNLPAVAPLIAAGLSRTRLTPN